MPGNPRAMASSRSGAVAWSKSEAESVWTLDGTLSLAMAPGSALVVICGAGTGVAGGAVAATGLTGRRTGGNGVVPMTWISGRCNALEFWLGFAVSCAEAMAGVITLAIAAARSSPHSVAETKRASTKTLILRANNPPPARMIKFWGDPRALSRKIVPNHTGNFWQSLAPSIP